jgi:CheY-like chemotaxis protein
MTTILIIDDNIDDIELTEIAVNAARPDAKIKTAQSGESALELLRKERELPSLILLDLKMCGMSGIELLKKIRSDSGLKKIPVVIVTSSSLQSDEKDSYAAGADGYLHKALDLQQFKDDVKSLLGRWV